MSRPLARSPQPQARFEELSLDELDEVSGGGRAGAVISLNGSIGPFSASISYSPTTGSWYGTAGVGKPGIGLDLSFGIVAPLPGKTIDDVLTGQSYGAGAYLGGGVRVDGNENGAVFQSGLGIGVGFGTTKTDFISQGARSFADSMQQYAPTATNYGAFGEPPTGTAAAPSPDYSSFGPTATNYGAFGEPPTGTNDTGGSSNGGYTGGAYDSGGNNGGGYSGGGDGGGFSGGD